VGYVYYRSGWIPTNCRGVGRLEEQACQQEKVKFNGSSGRMGWYTGGKLPTLGQGEVFSRTEDDRYRGTYGAAAILVLSGEEEARGRRSRPGVGVRGLVGRLF